MGANNTITTASSSSSGAPRRPTSFLTRNTCSWQCSLPFSQQRDVVHGAASCIWDREHLLPLQAGDGSLEVLLLAGCLVTDGEGVETGKVLDLLHFISTAGAGEAEGSMQLAIVWKLQGLLQKYIWAFGYLKVHAAPQVVLTTIAILLGSYTGMHDNSNCSHILTTHMQQCKELALVHIIPIFYTHWMCA